MCFVNNFRQRVGALAFYPETPSAKALVVVGATAAVVLAYAAFQLIASSSLAISAAMLTLTALPIAIVLRRLLSTIPEQTPLLTAQEPLAAPELLTAQAAWKQLPYERQQTAVTTFLVGVLQTSSVKQTLSQLEQFLATGAGLGAINVYYSLIPAPLVRAVTRQPPPIDGAQYTHQISIDPLRQIANHLHTLNAAPSVYATLLRIVQQYNQRAIEHTLFCGLLSWALNHPQLEVSTKIDIAIQLTQDNTLLKVYPLHMGWMQTAVMIPENATSLCLIAQLITMIKSSGTSQDILPSLVAAVRCNNRQTWHLLLKEFPKEEGGRDLLAGLIDNAPNNLATCFQSLPPNITLTPEHQRQLLRTIIATEARTPSPELFHLAQTWVTNHPNLLSPDLFTEAIRCGVTQSHWLALLAPPDKQMPRDILATILRANCPNQFALFQQYQTPQRIAQHQEPTSLIALVIQARKLSCDQKMHCINILTQANVPIQEDAFQCAAQHQHGTKMLTALLDSMQKPLSLEMLQILATCSFNDDPGALQALKRHHLPNILSSTQDLFPDTAQSPLVLAIASSNYYMVDRLLNIDTICAKKLVTHISTVPYGTHCHVGDTPLHSAVRTMVAAGTSQGDRVIQSNIMVLLRRHGAWHTAQNADGLTPSDVLDQVIGHYNKAIIEQSPPHKNARQALSCNQSRLPSKEDLSAIDPNWPLFE